MSLFVTDIKDNIARNATNRCCYLEEIFDRRGKCDKTSDMLCPYPQLFHNTNVLCALDVDNLYGSGRSVWEA